MPQHEQALSPERMAVLLAPYLREEIGIPAEHLYAQLGAYLDLLLRWNAKTNLTAIRDPEEIVCRHFGESLFAAALIPEGTRTLLDLGSGAGFPGVPMLLLRPELIVTLAESQGKKVAFLRELVRTLSLQVNVHAGRAEELVDLRSFDVVALRAVDGMEAAFRLAGRLTRGARLVLTTRTALVALGEEAKEIVPLPGRAESVVALIGSFVPRGTLI